MRYRRQDILSVVKSDLQIEFAKQSITSYSGLELFRKYFHLINLNSRIRSAFRGFDFGGDYSVVHYVLVFIALWLTGGKRLRHIGFIGDDPLVKRLCGLKTLPSDRTVSRWLGQFTNDSLQALVKLNSDMALEKVGELDLKTVTLDFDGTVLSCGNQVEWAFRGYNPKRRYSKSYFPLLCYIAQTRHFLKVKNRPGNVHDGKSGALETIKASVSEVESKLGKVRLETRMDSAFFKEDILKYLLSSKIEFAMKVPMWRWLGLKDMINSRIRWNHSNSKLAWFYKEIEVPAWGITIPLYFFRSKISDKIPKSGHQLDLFTPDDGVYEYSVITSNKDICADKVLDFFNGRCAMEHQISELKGEFAFDVVPTRSYQGNSAHQNISLLAYNLVRNFQIDSSLTEARKKTAKRTNIFSAQSLKTLRFEMIATAGRILNSSGAKILRINQNTQREHLYQKIQKHLKAA